MLSGISFRNILPNIADNIGGFCLLATSDNKILDVLDIIKYGTNSVLGDLTKNLSNEEKEAFFFKNAESIYKI